ncbi:radical SAM family heme chaperone HemW [Thalassotalea ponticola]|uniref:radical SAM family heme chaperone HemW n=1 Tax=Thalassotalea ponticola TaxID=1523392 RepID=UPI0025B2EC7A|nr:radical SAM family heme chaperone HemW [Thalassotalea ponticola]MDN3652095.1 radical SAM family heme chaperone HemW [Thalassotalea ponticola]
MLKTPPLSLYVHIPWCVQKCPYCDFNSHTLKSQIDETAYINDLIADLDSDIKRFDINRPLYSVFIGGGTPSLLSSAAIEQLILAIKQRFDCRDDMEITMEANPGTVEAEKFKGFANAGVNRLSIGVQSFASDKLLKLGRIHDSQQAINAAQIAKQCGIKSFNLDLMHGLEQQSINGALDDLRQAIALQPDHLSWYQLTIEPNTSFYSKPPTLPADDVLWDIQEQGFALLAEAGYQQYEVSAFAKSDSKRCRHNLNYWQHGDYLGIGCGAHGKITDATTNTIWRTVKVKSPKSYMLAERDYLERIDSVDDNDRTFEYMMNRLRLFSPFSAADFESATGIAIASIEPMLSKAIAKGLLNQNAPNEWQITALGRRYLNDLLTLFL